jgi:hypothetical protein
MNQEHSVVLCSLAQGDLLRDRCAQALGTAGLALMLAVAPSGVARAQTAPVGVPDKSFPESVTSTSDGTLYAGSFNLGGVTRIAAGGKAEQFIKPGGGDSRSTLGVLADEKSGLLYVCSNDITGFDVPGAGAGQGWRRPRRHRVRVGRQSLRHDLYPGCVVSDRRQGRQGRRGHGAEIVAPARSCGCDARGKLDKVTVKGDAAEIETIKDGFAEPVSVTQVGNTAWVAEGKLSYIIGDNKEKDPGAFALKPVMLPK